MAEVCLSVTLCCISLPAMFRSHSFWSQGNKDRNPFPIYLLKEDSPNAFISLPPPYNLLIYNINYNRNSYLKMGFHESDCTT